MAEVRCYSCNQTYDPALDTARRRHLCHADAIGPRLRTRKQLRAERERLLALLDMAQEDRDHWAEQMWDVILRLSADLKDAHGGPHDPSGCQACADLADANALVYLRGPEMPAEPGAPIR